MPTVIPNACFCLQENVCVPQSSVDERFACGCLKRETQQITIKAYIIHGSINSLQDCLRPAAATHIWTLLLGTDWHGASTLSIDHRTTLLAH